MQALNHLKKDKVMARIIKQAGGCSLKPSRNYFKTLVKSIIYQQLSTKAATTIYNRFIAEVKVLNSENILNLKDSQFKKAGISAQKKSYLIDLSKKYKKTNWSRLSDKEIIENLVRIKGIGTWSAEMFLIFAMNRPDVFPLDDLGIKRAIKLNYKIEPTKENMIKLSRKWSPYCSIAAWYLWRAVD